LFFPAKEKVVFFRLEGAEAGERVKPVSCWH
jgi:hypothetical protein